MEKRKTRRKRSNEKRQKMEKKERKISRGMSRGKKKKTDSKQTTQHDHHFHQTQWHHRTPPPLPLLTGTIPVASVLPEHDFMTVAEFSDIKQRFIWPWVLGGFDGWKGGFMRY